MFYCLSTMLLEQAVVNFSSRSIVLRHISTKYSIITESQFLLILEFFVHYKQTGLGVRTRL